LIAAVAIASLSKRRRSFQHDARLWAKDLQVEVRSAEHLPNRGPAVVVMNHFHRPGFQAWWFALAIAAYAPLEMHWVMTAAWTDDGTPGAAWRARVSTVLLPRLAKVYGFTSMPPMPPRPHEIRARAWAVRDLLRIARTQSPPVIAIAPEGQDTPTGALMQPHPGVGRLLALLGETGATFHPVGVYETERLVLSCGRPFALENFPRTGRDQAAAALVMRHIAELLPPFLQGDFAK
jgi:1-acyl-sn-glycerol-3-phosphate acyltransferase